MLYTQRANISLRSLVRHNSCIHKIRIYYSNESSWPRIILIMSPGSSQQHNLLVLSYPPVVVSLSWPDQSEHSLPPPILSPSRSFQLQHLNGAWTQSASGDEFLKNRMKWIPKTEEQLNSPRDSNVALYLWGNPIAERVKVILKCVAGAPSATAGLVSSWVIVDMDLRHNGLIDALGEIIDRDI